MGWLIEYWNGSSWVELIGPVEQIVQELNGHEEATFFIANDATNRAIIDSDRDTKISFDTVEQFRGLLSGAVYSDALLKCILYVECYSKMKKKEITNTYETVSANTVLQDICTAAGVVKGVCPTTAVSVRFRRTICFDAATFLALAVNKDFWSDKETGNPRFNIGDRGSAKGAITPLSWPDRGTDREKVRDKVIIRGVDANGVEIEGSAGTGTNVAVFTEKKASDVATLNNIAAFKLAALNKESSGVAIPVAIDVAKNLFPGDTVTLNKANLKLVGDFRVWKVTKGMSSATIEVDRPQDVTDKQLAETKQYEDLGIYPVANEQISDDYYYKPTDNVDDITDVAVSPPTLTIDVQEIDVAVGFRTWLKITVTRVVGASGYIISFNKTGFTAFQHIAVEQPASGDPVVVTPDLEPKTTYDIKACSISKLGMASAWSSIQNKTTSTNNVAPPVPTGLTAVAVVDGVWLYWDELGPINDFSHFKVYKGTSSPPTIHYASVPRSMVLWKKTPAENYVTHYFAVTAVDTAGNESAKCTDVSATPLRVKPIDLQIENRPWTADFKMWEGEVPPKLEYGYLYWAAKDGTSNISVQFADGTNISINANISGTYFTAGLRYFYWQQGQSALQNTTDYATAVGEGKGLICVVDVRNDRRSTILPFDSYMPTIGSGAIAAKTILADHIKAEQITTNLLAALAVTSDKIAANAVIAAKIYAGAVTTDKLDALAVTAEKLAANSVISAKIAAGEVHTAHILFDLLTSDPTYAAGKMWYRSDKDQLRFAAGTALQDVSIIPKYPCFDIQAPPENMLPNQAFEFDRDADDIPDNWTSWSVVSGSGSRTKTLAGAKGSYALRITANTSASRVEAGSDFVPVRQSRKYYVAALVYCQYDNNSDITIKVTWYDINKAYVSDTFIAENYNGSVSWTTREGVVTAPSTARFAKVWLDCDTPTTAPAFVQYDDIVLSELRAAVPTAGVVAGIFAYSGSTSVLGWTTIKSLTIPDVDHEEFEFQINTLITTWGGSDLLMRCRAYDSTDDKYYPDSTLEAPVTGVNQSSHFLIRVPKNVKNHNFTIQLQMLSFASTVYWKVNGWGYSQHFHK